LPAATAGVMAARLSVLGSVGFGEALHRIEGQGEKEQKEEHGSAIKDVARHRFGKGAAHGNCPHFL